MQGGANKFHRLVTDMNGQSVQRKVCRFNGIIAMHAPLECHSVSFPCVPNNSKIATELRCKTQAYLLLRTNDTKSACFLEPSSESKWSYWLKLMSKANYVQLAQEISWRLGASISRRSGPHLFQQTVWPIERQVCTEGASQD
jgi:hypothetical protein